MLLVSCGGASALMTPPSVSLQWFQPPTLVNEDDSCVDVRPDRSERSKQ